MRAGVLRLLMIGFAWLAFTPAAAAQPNIVLILTDDQRWDTIAGMPTVQSELVAKGVSFENAFVTNPRCCPSRASILTGAYSHTTRVYQNGGSLGGFAAFRDASTIATWLQGVGYETAFVGKYLNGYSGEYVPPGWDHWMAFTSIGDGYTRYGLNIDGVTHAVEDRPYSTDFLAQEAVGLMRDATQPFFLSFAPYAPHTPATPAERHQAEFADLAPWRPPSYNERNVSDKPAWLQDEPRLGPAQRAMFDAIRANQLRSLLAVDDAVAQILQAVADRGELDNTLFVFMSDNGYLWGEHRLRGKRVPYQESIRVPLMLRFDGAIAAPRAEARIVAGIDLAPTFAALAETTAPGAEGRSLVPLFDDVVEPWRKAILVESRRTDPPTYCASRTRRYSFVVYRTGEIELYDLPVDPYELRNLSGTAGQRTTIRRLRAQLARLCNPPPPGLSRKLLCTHVGTNGSETVTGSRRYDIVCARGGGDAVNARGGADYIFAEGGNDRVYARDSRADVISCGLGTDVALVDRLDLARADCEFVRRG